MGTFPAYPGDKPFGFISYSHADIVKVEHIYNILRRQGIRIWYDDMGNGITAGEKWNERIDERLSKSSVFLCFLANGVENRSEVIREIKLARKLKKEKPGFKIIFIFLERISLSGYQKSIANFIKSSQFVSLYRYGGITEEFLRRIVNHKIWPADCVDDAARKKNGYPSWADSVDDEIEAEVFEEESNYIYNQAAPQRTEFEGKYYYRVSRTDIDKGTVYPICIDNQWCPENYLNDKNYIKNGFKDDAIRNSIVKRQTNEVIRLLLHNTQIVVNRATVQNSAVFLQWYINYNNQMKMDEHEAFCKLLRNGSIVICLFGEENPWGKADYQINDRADYDKLCMENEVFCLRLDWDNATNDYLIKKNIAMQFHNSCIVMPEFEMDFFWLCKTFDINGIEKQQAFRQVWRDIQAETINYSKENNKLFTRQLFYEKFIIKDGTKVEHSIIDRKKPFSAELKQIIDYIYSTNLPRALGIQPIIPEDSRIRFYDEYGTMLKGAYREISVEEMCCAIADYWPAFVTKEYELPKSGEYTIADVCNVRSLSGWKRYVNTVLSGRKRATENEIDFYDINQTWKSYSKVFAEMRSNQVLSEDCWEKKKMTLSVTYKIGRSQITTVYSEAGVEVISRRDNAIGRSKSQNAIVAVDYSFCDVRQEENINNPFFVSRCLFRGIAQGNELEIFDRISSFFADNKKKVK